MLVPFIGLSIIVHFFIICEKKISSVVLTMKTFSFAVAGLVGGIILGMAIFSVRLALTDHSNFQYLSMFARELGSRSAWRTEVLSSVDTSGLEPKLFGSAKEQILNGLKKSKKEFGVWVWTSPHEMSVEDQEKTLEQAVRAGFRTVYVTIDDYIDVDQIEDPDVREEQIIAYENSVDSFLKIAARYGIAVHAEAGGKTWAFSSNRSKAYVIADFVLEHNKKSLYKFQSLQFDIEPYDLPEYYEHKKEYLSDYLRLVRESKLLLGDKLPLSLAIPEFYDSADEVPLIFFEGKTALPFEHLLSLLSGANGDSLVVLAYSDSARGEKGSVAISKDEVMLASKMKNPIRIVIASETGHTGASPDEILSNTVTFFGKTKSYVFSQLQIIDNSFGFSPAYGGIAVHYLDTYLALKEE